MAIEGLRVRKLADQSGERITRYNPETGEKYLVNPETGEPENWPFLGLKIEGKPPKVTALATSFVIRGQAEGWLSLDNPRMVHRPGGPPEDPWRVTHTFTHADAVTLKTVDGDVRYRVVDNPDKWPESKNEQDEGFGGEVRWYFRVRLEG